MAQGRSQYDDRTFIIAEAGVNHNGKIELALDLVDAAAEAGADAVKFQTYATERLVSPETSTPEYQRRSGETDQYQMLKRYELSPEEFEDIAEYCNERDIEFVSTPYDRDSVGLLADLEVSRIKIASADIINKPLLKKAGRSGREVILSTGMASVEEMAQAVDWVREAGAEDIALLHCVSAYPTDPEDLNLRFMESLDGIFDLPVGFSDHTLGLVAPLAAVARGARIVEKHITLDKSMEGPDHEASIEPEELGRLVSEIRECERSLGRPHNPLTDEERSNAKRMRPSLHAACNLNSGDKLTSEAVAVVRPADGLPPRFLDQIKGASLRRDLDTGEAITWKDLI